MYTAAIGGDTSTMNAHANNHDHTSPITTMYGSHTPWKAPEFPLVLPNRDHAVLYKISTDGFHKPPDPLAGHDKWDSHHVKMPTSDKSLHDVSKAIVFTSAESRWKIIEKALKKPIKDSHDLAQAIIKYNTKFANTWHFASMHAFFNQYWEPRESKEFFKNTLPSLARLALDLHSLIQTPIPMLRKDMNKSISLSQLQIASLLANAFFCTFPRRNTTTPGSEYGEYPRINFTSLYESNAEGIMEKLKCVCHYFKRVCAEMPIGVLTFSRRSVSMSSCPNWERSQVTLGSVPFHVDDQVHIEDAEGTIQVDFANKYLGGGVLGGGLVQEEIRFMICPELMVGMLFTEKLGPNDALMILGCERYSRYTGYGRVNFRWAGDFRDSTPLDSSGRKRCAVLAIDAQNFYDERRQYHKDMIFRELNKAYIGFSFFTDHSSPGLQYPGVATGNWGCGAFNGDPQLKALVQLMACAQARRPIAYLTFKDANLKNEVINVFSMLKHHEVTVGWLFKLITWYHKMEVRTDLHTFVRYCVETKMKPPAHQSPVLPAHQTTLSNPYRASNPYGSSSNYHANSGYNPSVHVSSGAGRGCRFRSSAPSQSTSWPSSPPASASAPLYSGAYDRPGGKRCNTEPSVHQGIGHTRTNSDVQGHSQTEYEQNYAHKYGTRNADEGRASSKQHTPSPSDEELISFEDEPCTSNRGQPRGSSDEQPPPPGFKEIRNVYEQTAHDLAPPGTEGRSDHLLSYNNQPEPHNHSVTPHIAMSQGGSNEKHYDKHNRASDPGRNTLSSEERSSRIHPNIGQDMNNQRPSKPVKNTQFGVTPASAPSWLTELQQQPRNKAPAPSAWQNPLTSATHQGSAAFGNRHVPRETLSSYQGPSRSAWQEPVTHQHDFAQPPTGSEPMEIETSSSSSLDADAPSQEDNQKVDNPSAHRANFNIGQPISQRDITECEQTITPSAPHLTQFCDEQMADESGGLVGVAISTAL